MIKLEILIPTFNRAEDLRKNLAILKDQILTSDLQDLIEISISDNCSEDHTSEVVAQFQSSAKEIHLSYIKNETNIGLEPNVVQLLKNASAPYLLWLGDDDYLADGYLQFVLSAIEGNSIGVIISGLSALKENGDVVLQRDHSKPIVHTVKGYDDMLTFSHLAHQMSGLVVKRNQLYESYIQNDHFRNPYLFIFMAADRLLHYDGIYAPKFSTLISDFNPKDWSYNKVGLLDEVFKSYYPFLSELGEARVKKLLVRFSVLHSYRYELNKFKPLRLLKQYLTLTKTLPPIAGLKGALAIHLLKDYLLTWKR